MTNKYMKINENKTLRTFTVKWDETSMIFPLVFEHDGNIVFIFEFAWKETYIDNDGNIVKEFPYKNVAPLYIDVQWFKIIVTGYKTLSIDKVLDPQWIWYKKLPLEKRKQLTDFLFNSVQLSFVNNKDNIKLIFDKEQFEYIYNHFVSERQSLPYTVYEAFNEISQYKYNDLPSHLSTYEQFQEFVYDNPQISNITSVFKNNAGICDGKANLLWFILTLLWYEAQLIYKKWGFGHYYIQSWDITLDPTSWTITYPKEYAEYKKLLQWVWIKWICSIMEEAITTINVNTTHLHIRDFAQLVNDNYSRIQRNVMEHSVISSHQQWIFSHKAIMVSLISSIFYRSYHLWEQVHTIDFDKYILDFVMTQR